jgi:MinD superfamily P-loop ATPase
MKQIVVISGKGGTGKTVFTAALGACMTNGLLVDCDVDASNLHLLLCPTVREKHIFKSGVSALRNPDLCTQCGECLRVCRFGAVSETYEIDRTSCEGCSLCARLCPSAAITMHENTTGEWYISDTRLGVLVHAHLGIGEENSGKLVHTVRSEAKKEAERLAKEWILIDGPPGIGCPVIASLTDVDLALIVTEPTLSGLHDAMRVIQVARHFNTPVKVIINKCDINSVMSTTIRGYCKDAGIECSLELPFDERVVKGVREVKTIMETEAREIKERIKTFWAKLEKELTA